MGAWSGIRYFVGALSCVQKPLGMIFSWIIPLVYGINLVMHFMIAELSYNNGGAQFIKCFEKELLWAG